MNAVDILTATGTAARFHGAPQQDSGSATLVMLALFVAGIVIGLIWKWRKNGN